MKRTLLIALLIAALFAPIAFAAPGGGPGGPGGKLSRFFPPPGYLDLTEEQRDATRELIDALRAEIEPLRDQQRDLRSDLRDALDADSPNAETVGAAVIALHELRGSLRGLTDEAVQNFRTLLDADQQAKFDNYRELRARKRFQRRGKRGGGADGGDGDAEGDFLGFLGNRR
ncbi:MAG: periplasmic heavy metal sensor [Acidobacteriota bacterium]